MDKTAIILISVFSAIIGGYLLIRLIITFISKPPDNLGIKNGKLGKCEFEKSFINSQQEKEYNLDPVSYEKLGGTKTVHEKIIQAIKEYGRSKIITEKPNYIHAIFRTGIWGFIDDTEFYLDEEEKRIHFRSSSRLGSYDWGTNKERMQKLLKLIQQ